MSLCLVLAPLALVLVGSVSAVVDTVILVGVSGLSASVLERAIQIGMADNIKQLILQGAYTFDARSQAPSYSMSNWASVLTSTSVTMHAVFDDDWSIEDGDLHPETGFCKGFPTVFSMVKAQTDKLYTGAYVSWDPLLDLFHHMHLETVCCDHRNKTEDSRTRDNRVYDNVMSDIHNDRFPHISFVQYSQVKEVGLAHGWESDEQMRSIRTVDEYIGNMVSKIKDSESLGKSMVILTADHGGCGKLSDGVYGRHYVVIPWIAWSPGLVKANHEIQMSVSNMDTTSTALHSLGLKQAIQCTGRPILEVFESITDDYLKTIPGYGFSFSWQDIGVVDDSANYTSSQCFKRTERCAKVVQVINHVFVSGVVAGTMILITIFSCLSLFCYYVRPDSRRRYYGICDFTRIWTTIKYDFDCTQEVRNAYRRIFGNSPSQKPSIHVEYDDSSSCLELDNSPLNHPSN
jgi:hypothetical protein